MKTGHSSTKKVFGVHCEGQHSRGCRARYMVHMSSDVGPEQNLDSCTLEMQVDQKRRVGYPRVSVHKQRVQEKGSVCVMKLWVRATTIKGDLRWMEGPQGSF